LLLFKLLKPDHLLTVYSEPASETECLRKQVTAVIEKMSKSR